MTQGQRMGRWSWGKSQSIRETWRGEREIQLSGYYSSHTTIWHPPTTTKGKCSKMKSYSTRPKYTSHLQGHPNLAKPSLLTTRHTRLKANLTVRRTKTHSTAARQYKSGAITTQINGVLTALLPNFLNTLSKGNCKRIRLSTRKYGSTY